MAESRNSGSGEATERDKIIKAIYAAKISPQESLNKSEEAEDAIDFDKKNTELSYQNRIAKKNNRRVWNWTLLVLVALCRERGAGRICAGFSGSIGTC